MDPPEVQASLAVSRQIVHRPQSVQDWENQKAKITSLYESNELKATMKIMQEQHGFKATINQYKKQLGRWGLDHKRIRDTEYQAMLKKKRKREEEDPRKESAFRLRGAEVDSSKITRYKKRKGINEDDVTSDVGTPSDLSCYTPSPISSIPSPVPIESANANGGTEALSDACLKRYEWICNIHAGVKREYGLFKLVPKALVYCTNQSNFSKTLSAIDFTELLDAQKQNKSEIQLQITRAECDHPIYSNGDYSHFWKFNIVLRDTNKYRIVASRFDARIFPQLGTFIAECLANSYRAFKDGWEIVIVRKDHRFLFEREDLHDGSISYRLI